MTLVESHCVGRISVHSERVDRGLRHIASHRCRPLRKRQLVGDIKVELAGERALSAEAVRSWRVSCARLAQLRHLGKFLFPLGNQLLTRDINISTMLHGPSLKRIRI